MSIEMDKLERYLKLKGVKYTRERHFNFDQIIVYEKFGGKTIRAWDAICHRGSYGYEKGLIEIMGNIVDEEKDGDSVAGWLTAEDVINRINGRR